MLILGIDHVSVGCCYVRRQKILIGRKCSDKILRRCDTVQLVYSSVIQE